jgi:hypothetical protein
MVGRHQVWEQCEDLSHCHSGASRCEIRHGSSEVAGVEQAEAQAAVDIASETGESNRACHVSAASGSTIARSILLRSGGGGRVAQQQGGCECALRS